MLVSKVTAVRSMLYKGLREINQINLYFWCFSKKIFPNMSSIATNTQWIKYKDLDLIKKRSSKNVK